MMEAGHTAHQNRKLLEMKRGESFDASVEAADC